MYSAPKQKQSGTYNPLTLMKHLADGCTRAKTSKLATDGQPVYSKILENTKELL